MCANQWESIQVIADILIRHLPTLHRVAVLAVRSKLPAMNVCMAVSTVIAHLVENQAAVALGAGDFLVHATQRISGLVVVELGI
jgi:hypothetical protein